MHTYFYYFPLSVTVVEWGVCVCVILCRILSAAHSRPSHATSMWFASVDSSPWMCTQNSYNTVGGAAQWLGCRSLASRLSLPCTQSMVDRWPLCW